MADVTHNEKWPNEIARLDNKIDAVVNRLELKIDRLGLKVDSITFRVTFAVSTLLGVFGVLMAAVFAIMRTGLTP